MRAGTHWTLYYYQKEINVEVSSAVVTNDGSTIR